MATISKIEWTHHSFAPWRGCVKVSAGCLNCYAETLSYRNPKTLGTWGHGGTRAIAAESYWRLPVAWDRKAAEGGVRRRVFCSHLSDVFEDREELTGPRARLFQLIEDTPNLDWLILTKRPIFAREYLTQLAAWPFANVWLGVSVEDQANADRRIPTLLETPAALRFLSCEPLLGPVDLHPYLPGLDWLIVGGESGARSKARPCRLDWISSLVAQAHDPRYQIPVFVKQLGRSPLYRVPSTGEYEPYRHGDYRGEDPEEWPPSLRVREFPTPRRLEACA
jgi:protein gp37